VFAGIPIFLHRLAIAIPLAFLARDVLTPLRLACLVRILAFVLRDWGGLESDQDSCD
jgi:hypothetical protein